MHIPSSARVRFGSVKVENNTKKKRIVQILISYTSIHVTHNITVDEPEVIFPFLILRP